MNSLPTSLYCHACRRIKSSSRPAPAAMPAGPMLLLLFLAVATTVYAQYGRTELRQRHYMRQQRSSNVSLALGGGVGELVADGRLLDPSYPGATFLVDAAYTYLWDRLSGIRVGLGVTYLHSRLAIEGAETSSTGQIELFDADGTYTRSTHFTAATTAVSEGYDAVYVTLPLHLVLQRNHFFSALGVRLMVPLHVGASYSHGATHIGVGREVDGTGTTLARPVEMLSLEAQEGSYTLPATRFVSAAVSVEAGYRYAVDAKKMLTVALYADVALNRSHHGGDGLAALDGDGYHISHVLESGMVSALRYCAVGVRVTYGFSFGSRIRTGNPFRVSRSHRPRYVM